MDPQDETIPADDLTFHHYRVLRREDGSPWKLGAGGMGTTYKAKDTNLDAIVALKVISVDLLNQDPYARDRFVREAKAAASLRHPHAATVYHLGKDRQSYFYAMEFIAGETVEERVRQVGPFTAPEALALMLQATRALAAAHRLGLIHRDIKPANLMLVEVNEDEGEGLALKLIDFGLAKSVGGAGPGHDISQRSALVLTPAYASPEQCQDLPADIRGDIYSLGVTLWFMLIGVPTFRARSTFELQNKHVSAPPPLEELEAAEVPAPVRDLLARMLEKDPADRPQSPADLRREIEACQRALNEKMDGKEIPPPPPYSFTLEDLLRRRGGLTWAETRPLLAPLAAIADDLAASGADALANFAARRLHAVFPSFQPPAPETEGSRPDPSLERPADWATLWPDFQLIPRTAGDTAPRQMEAFGATQPPALPQYRNAPQALAALLYELIGGHPPDLRSGGVPRPLAGINEEGNTLLRRALLGGSLGFNGNAKDLRAALEQAADAPVRPQPKPPLPDPAPVPVPPFPRVLALMLMLVMLGGLGLVFLWAKWNPSKEAAVSPSPSPSPTLFYSPAPFLGLRSPTPFPKFYFASPVPTLDPKLLAALLATPTPTPIPKLDLSALFGRTLLVPDGYLTIQAAINAAAPGDTVRVRAGTYTETLSFKAGVHLIGAGREQTIVRCPAAKGDVLAVRDCASGWISDLCFEQTDLDKSNAINYGVWLSNSAVDLRRCHVRFTKKTGIGCESKDRSLVEDCEASDCGQSGILVSAASPRLVHNQVHGNKLSGISFQKGAAGQAENNVCENNLEAGILVSDAGTAPALTGNQTRGNRYSGIAFATGAAGLAEGNLSESNDQSGIVVFDANTAPTLQSNRCLNNKGYGIWVDNGARPTIIPGNTLLGNKEGSIRYP